MSFSFNYPQSSYNLATTTTVDISLNIIGVQPPGTIYGITPATLPYGMSIDHPTGTISGTTTFSSISPAITYRVDASANNVTVGHTFITISINFIPVFNYALSPYILKISESVTIIPTYLISNISGIFYNTAPDVADIGLHLNLFTGIVTGAPNKLTDFITYTITANNNGILYSTPLIISVQNAPTVSYPQPNYILTQGIPVNIIPLTSQNQTNIKYELSGCYLPFGLTFNTVTGEISGSPSVLSPPRSYTITVTNNIGSSTATLILYVIKEFMAPPVVSDNFSSNTFLTDPAIAMRRKAEILKYKKNSTNLTKQQYFSLLAKGNSPAAKRSWGNQGNNNTDPNQSGLPLVGNTLVCPPAGLICAPTSSSDVPGPIMNLCYNPAVPVVGYVAPNRFRVNIGFKWPQRAWQRGDIGFPVGKAGNG